MNRVEPAIFVLVLFMLSACENRGGPGGSDVPNVTKNAFPEVNQSPKGSRSEDFSCNSESTELIHDEKNNSAYFQITRNASKGTRTIFIYDDGVEKISSTHVVETSHCISYEASCNQSWTNATLGVTSETLKRVTSPSPGQEFETLSEQVTMSLQATDDESDKEYFKNGPVTKRAQSSVLVRVEGSLRHFIESKDDGISTKYDGAIVKEIMESGNSRTERIYLLRPISDSSSRAEQWTSTTLKNEETCTYTIN